MSLLSRSLAAATLLVVAQATAADGGGFAAVVAPPRFELSSTAGATVHKVFELANRSASSAKFRVHTADFALLADYTVEFQDTLAPGSCRPWVALERPEVNLPGGGMMRYRFEVQVPAAARAGECRFAILIEGEEPSLAHTGSLTVPIAGRIAIIVYLILGDAKPDIEIFGPQLATVNGRTVPALRVQNSGNAHARLAGFLYGTDATGHRYDFNPSTLPILPGEVRQVLLMPSVPGDERPSLTFPVTVRGKLEWSDRSTELNERFE